MFLSHQTIQKYIDEGKIIVEPDFEKKNIRPVGLRIHLAKDILIPEPNQVASISGSEDLKYKKVDLSKEDFHLEPGQFILGATYESIKTPKDVMAILDGRSTVARIGLTTHITASIADGTFGEPHSVVLEIKNVGNFKVKLKHKDPIAMMAFTKLTEPVVQELQSQYKAQKGVQPPNLNFKTGKDK